MKQKVLLVTGGAAEERRLLERLPQLGCEVVVAHGAEDVERALRELALLSPPAPRLPEPAALAASALRPSGDTATSVSTQGLEIDERRFRCLLHGRELKLTLTEFKLLLNLARQAGVVLSRRELAQTCLPGQSDVQERTIDVHVKTLRQKLGETSHLVETVRGVGYRFREETV